MRSIIQRVTRASVSIDGQKTAEIGPGLLVLLGVTHTDGPAQVEKTARKIAQLRILRAGDGGDSPKERRSAEEAGAPVLVVSQFTLYADVRKGRSPSWSHAAPGDVAEPIYEQVVAALRDTHGLEVSTGQFGADMAVELVNDGPFTLLVEV
ncbi:D-aminoacyl-tRNA deacylase [Neoactinobaculum massilliense]|uniref:D-aminoacyl-tRNA deacylase n=1 Tax=Neoactinobaculum massilliense TaxID=2364794 RepID=UPI000F52042C|nr:D-aminoacyl-tRNA deacylase [Neoactinobaculum massilliense]